MSFEALEKCVIDGRKFSAGDQFEAGSIGKGFLKSALNRRMIRDIEDLTVEAETQVLTASELQSARSAEEPKPSLFDSAPEGPAVKPPEVLSGSETQTTPMDASAAAPAATGEQGAAESKPDDQRQVRKRSG